MDSVIAIADHSIRRACAFAGLGIGTVMLALSYELPLAFRSAAALTAVFWLGLLVAAWRAPRRDIRHSELWSMLPGTEGEFAHQLPRAEAQRLLAGVLRTRLIWHAERVAILALGFWLLALLSWALNLLRG